MLLDEVNISCCVCILFHSLLVLEYYWVVYVDIL